MLFSDLPVGGNNDLGKVAVVKQVSPVFVFFCLFLFLTAETKPLFYLWGHRGGWWQQRQNHRGNNFKSFLGQI